MEIIVEKRMGELVAFDESKILAAIKKANMEVSEEKRISDIEIHNLVTWMYQTKLASSRLLRSKKSKILSRNT